MPLAKYPEYAAYQREYRTRNPEKIFAQKLRYYAKYLERNGYKVIPPEEEKKDTKEV